MPLFSLDSDVYVQRDPSKPLNGQLCSVHVFVCVLYVIKNCIEPFKTRIWGSEKQGYIPMGIFYTISQFVTVA
jgi:hypothetical protein